ncbi:PadR family transcriptional regulator [Micromonospora sp. WMMC241]|uniref:Transcriptional regulator, PadR family n=1 Tax=Micromonospora humi TaxID=745366 RepID=A0A1C5HJ32_9ACTN|nr:MULTISPECIES: PadR family transcriptional regulator [Micromonospora]MCZ7436192.1 PadR family transcriptional regulator [Micromonospora sp. WMMC241]SCG45877.1 transcriptional regulator, PadR family [Micromonospora humi]
MRLTIPVVKVLSALLAEPDAPRYGLDLMRLTGLPSGTLYPVLHRLQAAAWLAADWEDVDPVAAGRPARRYYRLTGEGIRAGRLALAELRALAPAERPHQGGAGATGAAAW